MLKVRFSYKQSDEQIENKVLGELNQKLNDTNINEKSLQIAEDHNSVVSNKGA